MVLFFFSLGENPGLILLSYKFFSPGIFVFFHVWNKPRVRVRSAQTKQYITIQKHHLHSAKVPFNENLDVWQPDWSTWWLKAAGIGQPKPSAAPWHPTYPHFTFLERHKGTAPPTSEFGCRIWPEGKKIRVKSHRTSSEEKNYSKEISPVQVLMILWILVLCIMLRIIKMKTLLHYSQERNLYHLYDNTMELHRGSWNMDVFICNMLQLKFVMLSKVTTCKTHSFKTFKWWRLNLIYLALALYYFPVIVAFCCSCSAENLALGFSNAYIDRLEVTEVQPWAVFCFSLSLTAISSFRFLCKSWTLHFGNCK